MRPRLCRRARPRRWAPPRSHGGSNSGVAASRPVLHGNVAPYRRLRPRARRRLSPLVSFARRPALRAQEVPDFLPEEYSARTGEGAEEHPQGPRFPVEVGDAGAAGEPRVAAREGGRQASARPPPGPAGTLFSQGCAATSDSSRRADGSTTSILLIRSCSTAASKVPFVIFVCAYYCLY